MTVSPTGSGVVEAANFGRINVKNFPPSTTETCFNIMETITLTANPGSGYTFSRWSISGGTSYSGTRNPYSIQLPNSSDISTRVVAYFTGAVPPPPAGAESVTLDEAKAMIDSNNPVIVIDVRESVDFDAGHIICAQNYPWSSGYLQRYYTNFSNFQSYDILVYGKDRSPSDDAADFLAEEGFTSVYHMTDGMDGWVKRGWQTIDAACDCEICSLPPMAHAGPDQTVDEAEPVMLNGTGSSAPGSLFLSYLWEQIEGDQTVILSDETDGRPTFTAPYVQQGGDTIVFHLTVTNDSGQKDTDSVSIEVEWVNADVNADAGPDQSVMAGDTVTLNGTNSSDPDGEITAYHWELISGSSAIDTSEIVLSHPSGPITTFTAPDARGWVQFRLTVTDDNGDTDSDTVMITSNTEGGTSGLVADAGPDQVVAEGSTVTLNGSWSSSLDAVVKSYQWTKIFGPSVVLSGSDGMAPEATREINPTFTAPVIGSGQTELLFQFIVKDSNGTTGTDEVKVTVNSQAYISENIPPVADAGPDQSVIPGSMVFLDGSGSSDPEGNIFSYEWTVTSGPESIILSDSAAIQPTFIAPYASGSAIFQLIVTDDAGKTDQASVQISWINDPPVADAGPDQDVFERQTVALYGSGSFDSDDGIATYQWNKISGPAVSLSDSFAADPTFIAPETGLDPVVLIFKLIVTDSSGQVSTDQVEITVNNKNVIPLANAGADQRVNETTMVALDGSDSLDPDGDSLIYQWHQISGPAVSLNDAFISTPILWSPSIGEQVSPATVIMELTVADTEGQTSTDRVEIIVDDVGQAPIAKAGNDMSVYERQTVTLDGSESKDLDGEVTYLWTQTSGPTVILSDVSAASPTFTVPAVNPDFNVLTFRLMVEDSDGLVTFDEVAVTVDPSTEPPVADAGSDQEVDEGDMVILDASGSSDPDDGIKSYLWEQVRGELVVLSDNLAQKPAFEAPEISESVVVLRFKLTVEDYSGQQRSDSVAITINNKSSGSSGGCFISSFVE
ncbi:MAG: hypothetical protein HF978_06960 [Desulfobacteraceae bacterium]|nr:hypothetical protein [Desulfobacteraceae bacterium]MBC2755271.1 hypothetical protein [Desulfobacteraceae bacterium]